MILLVDVSMDQYDESLLIDGLLATTSSFFLHLLCANFAHFESPLFHLPRKQIHRLAGQMVGKQSL